MQKLPDIHSLSDLQNYIKRNPITSTLTGIWGAIGLALLLNSCDPKKQEEAAPVSPAETTSQTQPAQFNPNICEVQKVVNHWANTILVWNTLSPNSISFTPDSNDYSVIWWESIQYRLPNTLDTANNSLEIYFITNQVSLDESDKSDLRILAEQLNKVITGTTTLIIEWFADTRWTDERNNYLSQWRAETVRDFLLPLLKNGISIQIASYGETRSQELPSSTLEERLALRPLRKVTIIPTENIVTRALENSPADIYVLDASWSMQWAPWSAVESYTYPEGAQIFTFTTANQAGCAESIDSQTVDGGTPLYTSLLEIVSNTWYRDKTITLLSDGADTVGGNIEEIIRIATENWIKINVIGIGSYEELSLRMIAERTGGTIYFQQ